MSDYPDHAGAMPRRVAIVSLHADPSSAPGAEGGGGTHSYVRELLVSLPARGWSCVAVARWADAELPERQQISPDAGIVRVRIGDVAPIDKRMLDGMHEESLARVREAILSSLPAPRLLHSVYWNSGRVAADLACELGLRFVHTVISNGARRKLEGASENAERRIATESRVFSEAFRIFCVSPEEADDLTSLYDVDPEKIVVVGRPASIAFLRPSHDERGRPALLPPW
jgi:D-inositol-3-phosphate glycosyltransferase